jgi:hypothetical protein
LEVVRIEIVYVRPEADLLIQRASLYDSATGNSTPVDVLSAASKKWRRLAEFDPIEIYENLDVRPRVWFVSRIVVAPQPEVLRAIKTGYLRDGTRFDPAEVALLATEDFGPRAIRIPPIGDTAGAEVRVLRYEPQRISLETRQPQPGFMVLSEIYYRGWEAWVDGQRVPVGTRQLCATRSCPSTGQSPHRDDLSGTQLPYGRCLFGAGRRCLDGMRPNRPSPPTSTA